MIRRTVQDAAPPVPSKDEHKTLDEVVKKPFREVLTNLNKPIPVTSKEIEAIENKIQDLLKKELEMSGFTTVTAKDGLSVSVKANKPPESVAPVTEPSATESMPSKNSNEYWKHYSKPVSYPVPAEPIPDTVRITHVNSQQVEPNIETQIKLKIEELERQFSNLNSNVNKAVQEFQHKATAPKHIQYILNEDDLKALEDMLDSVEPLYNGGLYSQPRAGNYKTNINTSYTERDAVMGKINDGWITEADGTRKCYKDSKLHCDNGPAEIRTNGTQLFYRNGKLHRDGNLPAMIGVGGTEKYAVDGKYHRVGGLPAITWSKSQYRQEWWNNGEIQRAIKKDGTQEWFAPGSTERDDAIYHRMDGPAVIHPNGTQEFWIKGHQYRSRFDWEQAILNIEHVEKMRTQVLVEDPSISSDASDTETNQTNSNKKKEEKKTMSKPSFTETLKANAVSAGYRVAGTQSTTIVKNAILTIMKNKGADGGAIQGISAFLDTEFGAALIAFALGSALHYVPHFNEDPRVQRLGEEMRIGGMATAGNAVIGEAMAHVLPALTQVLQNLPALENNASNIRVESAHDSKLVEALEEEDVQTETTERKTAKA